MLEFNFFIDIQKIGNVVDKNFQIWLLIGWRYTASQSEARFENPC